MSASLTQIVAALSVTYRDSGVLTWLDSQGDHIAADRMDAVADAVRRIGDADPDDFVVVERCACGVSTEHGPHESNLDGGPA